MDSTASGLAAFGVFGFLFALLLAILWILVPFAIFGIKPLLGKILAEQRKTYAALATISQQIHTATLLAHPSSSATTLSVPTEEQESEKATLAEILRTVRAP